MHHRFIYGNNKTFPILSKVFLHRASRLRLYSRLISTLIFNKVLTVSELSGISSLTNSNVYNFILATARRFYSWEGKRGKHVKLKSMKLVNFRGGSRRLPPLLNLTTEFNLISKTSKYNLISFDRIPANLKIKFGLFHQHSRARAPIMVNSAFIHKNYAIVSNTIFILISHSIFTTFLLVISVLCLSFLFSFFKSFLQYVRALVRNNWSV